jgi:hypothetical protein
MLQEVKELVQQRGEFQRRMLSQLERAKDDHDIAAALCWSTQETAVATVTSVPDGHTTDVAQQCFACITAFEKTLREKSTIALGVALQSKLSDNASDDDASNAGSDGGGLAYDVFVERLLDRLEMSCPFAFSPLLHYFRAVLDPGTDPTGERGVALRERFDGRLARVGGQCIEAVFLRKELQVGKYEAELPFWSGEISFSKSPESTRVAKLGKDKDWSEMTTEERQAAETLGCSQATWTDPELLDPSDDPFLIDWENLAPSKQAAAFVLGYSQRDWEEDTVGDHDEGVGNAPPHRPPPPPPHRPPPPSLVLGKDKDWLEMTTEERQAAKTLGWSEASWTDPELLDLSDDSFLISWENLAPSKQAAASVLGYSQRDWDDFCAL